MSLHLMARTSSGLRKRWPPEMVAVGAHGAASIQGCHRGEGGSTWGRRPILRLQGLSAKVHGDGHPLSSWTHTGAEGPDPSADARFVEAASL